MHRRALLGALPLSLFAVRGEAQVRQLELAHYFVGPTLFGDELQRFADKLTAGSGGTLQVSVEPQAPLMPLPVMHSASALAHYYAAEHADVEPLLGLTALPLLAATFDEAEILLRIARPFYEAILARHGQMLLATEPWRPATVWSTFPIRSAADLKGTPFTQPTNIGRRFGWHKPLLRLGAVEVRYWDAEIVLVNGIIDGFKFPKEFGCFVELFYACQLNFLTVSRAVFDSLTELQRQLIVAEGRIAEQALWRFVKERVAREHREAAQRNVVVSAQPPTDLMAALREAAEPDIQDWARTVGADATAILAEYRRAVGRS